MKQRRRREILEGFMVLVGSPTACNLLSSQLFETSDKIAEEWRPGQCLDVLDEEVWAQKPLAIKAQKR